MRPAARICILTGSYYPAVGGGETHARLLAATWRKKGIRSLVITYRRQREFLPFERVEGTPVHRVGPPGHLRWGKYLMLLPAFFRLIRLRSEYDVIFVCGIRTLGWIAVPLARLFRKKVFLRSESCGEYSGDFIWDRPGGARRGRLLQAGLQWLIGIRNHLYSNADGFVAISSAIEEEYLRSGVPPPKISYITNGIDPTIYRPLPGSERSALREGLRLPPGRLVTYTGKLNRGKGLEMLLRAWTRIRSEIPDLHLLLVGSGGQQYLSCEDELRAFAAEHRLGSRVTFTGYVSNVEQYLQASDFFVFPSESEALGLSLVEAMACELPCVATAVGGILDVIDNEKDGLLVPGNDEGALEDAILRLVRDGDLSRRLAENARQKVLAKFSIDRIAERHRLLFEGSAHTGDGTPP